MQNLHLLLEPYPLRPVSGRSGNGRTSPLSRVATAPCGAGTLTGSRGAGDGAGAGWVEYEVQVPALALRSVLVDLEM